MQTRHAILDINRHCAMEEDNVGARWEGTETQTDIMGREDWTCGVEIILFRKLLIAME